MMIVCRRRADYYRLAQEFEDSVEDVPGTQCLLSQRTTFSFTSRQKKDHYRTYTLSPVETALLLSRQQIPDPKNLRIQRTCATDLCCNSEHLELLPCYPGGTNSTNRIGRIYVASTPEEAFPPDLLRPLSPRGYARCGTKNPHSSISDEEAEFILRQRYIHKRSYFSISAELERPMRSVAGVCTGHSRRDVFQRIKDDLVAEMHRASRDGQETPQWATSR